MRSFIAATRGIDWWFDRKERSRLPSALGEWITPSYPWKAESIGCKTSVIVGLTELRIVTECSKCIHKCCSQPYDWVYLTQSEIHRLESASGKHANSFVVLRRNVNTGHTFKTLSLPCQFLEAGTGRCSVYEQRPLICRLFPFYPEPLTGHATLLPVQCGENLRFVSEQELQGWTLGQFESEIRVWLQQIWKEAVHAELPPTARADGSP